MQERIQMTIYAPPCECCGEQSISNVKVFGADGFYCRFHAPVVAMLARHNTETQMAKMMATGVYRIPTESLPVDAVLKSFARP